MKRTIRLTESDLHRIVKESVQKILKESGESNRGSYLYGRAARRALVNQNDTQKFVDMRDKASHNDAFEKGIDDETMYGRNSDSTWDGNKYRRVQFNYDVQKMKDMDNLGRKFIDFIEHHDGGVLLQTIVDYESGNQTGTPQSPLGEIIPVFEEEVLGYECTPEMKQAIKRAYNEWWNYAESELMPYEEY